METYNRKNEKLYLCFIDLQNAFDKVPRELIGGALRKHDIPDAFSTSYQIPI